MSQTLYLKWRPSNWDEIIGQPHVVQTLKNAIAGERQAHAYLFSGPRGTGKTSAARILAKAVNCLADEPGNRPCDQCEHCKAIAAGRFLDLIEIDAASNTSVEDVRDLREKINYSPNHGRYKVYIIDEVHMLSTAAFNALLKTLEEPPAHAIFILATTEVHKIPATVLSRCQRYDFRRIPLPDLVQHLQIIVNQEKIKIEPIALTLIARQATGSMRDAISLLDQLASGGRKITLDFAETMLGTATSQAVLDIVENLATGQLSAGLDRIQIALDAGSEPRLFARQVVDYFRNVMLVKMGSAQQIDATEELKTQIARHAQLLSMSLVLKAIRAFNQAALEGRLAWQAALPLEMAFLDSLDTGQLPGDFSQSIEPKIKNKQSVQIPEPVKTTENIEGEQHAQGEPANTTEASDLTVKEINQMWRKYLAAVGQEDKHVQALLNSGKPYGVKGNVLYVGFKGDFAKMKLEREENFTLAEKVLQQVTGTEMKLRCILVTGTKGELPPDVENDSMVATALRELGGEIVDVQ